MHPVLCYLGPLPVYAYGLMLAVGVLVSSWLMARDAARIGVSKDTVYDLAFWVVVCGILGARFFFILLNVSYYADNLLEMVMLQKGGLAWQGSFIGGLAAALIFLRKRKIPVLLFLDVAAPYIALGHAIGRVGCLLNGCCYGKPAAWGLYFPVLDARLHPTQIYMALGQLVIFMLLRAFQPKAKFAGQVFIGYLLLSSVERFLVEFVRGDHDLYAGFSVFQYVCLGIFAGALILHYCLGRKK